MYRYRAGSETVSLVVALQPPLWRCVQKLVLRVVSQYTPAAPRDAGMQHHLLKEPEDRAVRGQWHCSRQFGIRGKFAHTSEMVVLDLLACLPGSTTPVIFAFWHFVFKPLWQETWGTSLVFCSLCSVKPPQHAGRPFDGIACQTNRSHHAVAAATTKAYTALLFYHASSRQKKKA